MQGCTREGQRQALRPHSPTDWRLRRRNCEPTQVPFFFSLSSRPVARQGRLAHTSPSTRMWQPPGPPLDAAAAAAAAQATAQSQAAQQVREGGKGPPVVEFRATSLYTLCWPWDRGLCQQATAEGRGAKTDRRSPLHSPSPQAAALQAASAPPHPTPTATDAAATLAAAAGAAARAAQLHALMAANPAVAADPRSLAELRQLQVTVDEGSVEWTDHAEREEVAVL